MLPIAHRGLWYPDSERQNTVDAMQMAVDRGFGIEIDVSKQNTDYPNFGDEEIGVGHNLVPPEIVGPSIHPYEEVLAVAPLILWNIKTLGLEQILPEFIFTRGLHETSIIFDQDFPGMPENYSREFLARKVKVLVRVSDREPDKVVGSDYHGVWLDQFDSDWVDQDVVAYWHDRGKAVFVVSPELHNRPLDLKKWFEWKEADGICTDFPFLASDLLAPNAEHASVLFPTNPWWQQPEWLQSVAEAQRMRP